MFLKYVKSSIPNSDNTEGLVRFIMKLKELNERKKEERSNLIYKAIWKVLGQIKTYLIYS